MTAHGAMLFSWICVPNLLSRSTREFGTRPPAKDGSSPKRQVG